MSLACFEFMEQFTCDGERLERQYLEPFLRHEGPHYVLTCAVCVRQVARGHPSAESDPFCQMNVTRLSLCLIYLPDFNFQVL